VNDGRPMDGEGVRSPLGEVRPSLRASVGGVAPNVEPGGYSCGSVPRGRASPRRMAYVIGIPGSGKSTALRGALDGLTPTVRSRPFARVDYELGAVTMLGRWRRTAPGTDALGMHVQPIVLRWLERQAELAVVAEGDRLGNRSFLLAVAAAGIELTVVLLDTPPELAARRRSSRGSRQDPAWIASRLTKVARLADLVDVRLDGTMSPSALATSLRELDVFAALR
jgi:hypothetical protein